MNIEIGKFTLESLTTGMYSDPMIVYREYIQNSVDSLDFACEQGIIEKTGMRIDILVDKIAKSIVIRDNGAGISSDYAASTLLNIGNSSKRHSKNRGFRGIGRLGGMSYCNTLVFTTSYEGEKSRTKVSFDCRRLRELLIPGEYEEHNLSMVINEITSVSVEEEEADKHYFWVEMLDVDNSTDLLEIDVVREYVSQVAPLPYKTKYFYYVPEIKDYCEKRNYIIDEFPIFIGDSERSLQPIYKPNRNRFTADRKKKVVDEISALSFFDVVIDEELYAVGWYADCGWYGTIIDDEVSGLRARKGNILIGDSDTLNVIFKEPRFNGWVHGEIFVITDKLIPNARRDDFEQNDAYRKFIEYLKNTIGSVIPKKIREASDLRNNPAARVLNETKKTINEANGVLDEGFNSSVDKEAVIDRLIKSEENLKKVKVPEQLIEEKRQLEDSLHETITKVADSSNYKINQIRSNLDRKSKKILEVVTDILSKKLSKFLVDEIIDEIIEELGRK